jgi:hypothetical protein
LSTIKTFFAIFRQRKLENALITKSTILRIYNCTSFDLRAVAPLVFIYYKVSVTRQALLILAALFTFFAARLTVPSAISEKSLKALRAGKGI